MPVYLIIEITITDPEIYPRYVAEVFDIVTAYGGRYLVRAGKITPLIGNWQPERMILIEFDSIAQVEKCFGSPEYLELAPLREQATASRALIVEGYSQSRIETGLSER
jgi:uncharacterized protein (DUF1330 family)